MTEEEGIGSTIVLKLSPAILAALTALGTTACDGVDHALHGDAYHDLEVYKDPAMLPDDLSQPCDDGTCSDALYHNLASQVKELPGDKYEFGGKQYGIEDLMVSIDAAHEKAVNAIMGKYGLNDAEIHNLPEGTVGLDASGNIVSGADKLSRISEEID